MKFSSHLFRFPGILGIAITVPRIASGCAVCSTALADYYFPPVLAWTLFFPAWFLVTASIASRVSQKVRFVPPPGRAFLVVLGLIIPGAILLGPFPLFLLGVPPLMVSLRVLRGSFPVDRNESAYRAFWINALAGIMVCILLVFIMIFTLSTRSVPEFVLKWESTALAHAMVQRLTESGQESLPALRILVRQAEPWTSNKAAQGLGSFGEPTIDVPILINAVGRVRKEQPGGSLDTQIELALRRLSGIELPNNTPVEEWRKAWDTQTDLR